ncbi:carbohydrate-binding protein, partial [Escherichia coli]|uniref:carbohydrate-binding protein n=1 Tax=Escherichia coli TaxID=562 RepID=UPI0011251094
VEQAGTYHLSLLTATPGNGRSISVAMEQNGEFYTASTVDVPNTGSWTDFVSTGQLTLDLEAGEQVLRVTFNGGSMDLKSLTLSKG